MVIIVCTIFIFIFLSNSASAYVFPPTNFLILVTKTLISFQKIIYVKIAAPFFQAKVFL